ncbi:MAG: DMT family transporter [Deltaproteobacteria bacterium]|nr:DMT family transporter [Deltaproteobacteria bacterium]
MKNQPEEMPAAAVRSPLLEVPLGGIGFMLAMTVCFSTLDASAKFITGELSLWMVMWGRYFFHLLFIAVFFLRGAPREIVSTRNLKMQVLRSSLIFCAGVTFWAGLIYLPLAECTVIAFISPLLVTILSVIFLGEKFGSYRWIVAVAGLAGVLLVVRPGAGIVHWAVILPVLSALFYATLQITTRILGMRDKALTTLFYTCTCGLVFSSVMAAFFWQTPSPVQWLLLMWLGLVGAAGHFFMIRAFERAPASLLASFDYATLVWAVLFGFFLFGDLPDGWTVVGAMIIVSSGAYLIRREKRAVIPKTYPAQTL